MTIVAHDDKRLRDAAERLVGCDLVDLLWRASPRAEFDRVAVVGVGQPVVPGAASGILCTTRERAEAALAGGDPVVLARHGTTIDDMSIARRAAALVTATGGTTSHSAVIARMWQLPATVGLNARIADGAVTGPAGTRVRDGDWVTLDATSGSLLRGRHAIAVDVAAQHQLEQALSLAATLEVVPGPTLYGNADTAEDALRCFDDGAKGVGVARTEHMFVGDDDAAVLCDAVWGSEAARRRALRETCARLVDKSRALLAACAGRRLAVRLLDPPLHEFLGPDAKHEHLERESNPMMGVRGVRLGIVYPQLYLMQVQALLTVLDSLPPEDRPRLGILIPFTNWSTELTRSKVWRQLRSRPDVALGSMVESPESVFNADTIASHVTFLSVGTNDLVQFCLAMSRDDVARQLVPSYVEAGILPTDPTADLSLSRSVMGLLRELRERVPPTGEWGICGEHAGHLESLRAVLRLAPSYVSASPGGLLAARLEIGRSRAGSVIAGPGDS